MENSKIASAFIKAKKAFGLALKDKINPAFRSKYADLGACLEAVDSALLENGIALYQETFEVDSGVMVETVMIHESGETIRCGKLHVPASKQDPQGYGSALTYARRYSLMAACGIAPEDDDGNAGSEATRRAEAKRIADEASKKAAGKRLPESVVADHLAAIQSASTSEQLSTAAKLAQTAAKDAGDKDSYDKFTSAKHAQAGALALGA